MQVVTAHALGRTIILIPAGLLIDRYGAKTAMLAGSALVLGGAAMTAVTPYFVLLCLGQFLAGVGDSVWTMGREVSGVELVPQHQRGRLLSGFMGVKSAGMALGPVAAGFLRDITGAYIWPLWLSFGLSVLAVVAIMFLPSTRHLQLPDWEEALPPEARGNVGRAGATPEPAAAPSQPAAPAGATGDGDGD